MLNMHLDSKNILCIVCWRLGRGFCTFKAKFSRVSNDRPGNFIRGVRKLVNLQKCHVGKVKVRVGFRLFSMVLSKYMTTKPDEAKARFESAILVSIAWDWLHGADSLEKPYINKYLINKALTVGLVRLGKK